MTYLRLLFPVSVALTLLLAGWLIRGWYEDSQRLTAAQAADNAIHAALSREATIAEAVETRLARQKVTQRIIDRGIIREIQKPIYQRVCLDPDGVRLLNAAAEGRGPDTAESDDPLPGDAADAPGRQGRDGSGDDE